jgi:hypothetical protein
MSNLDRGPSIDASYHVSDHLAELFQSRRFFINQPFRNKNRQWRPCLLTDWDGMSNLHREPSIDGSYQVSNHLAKQLEENIFRNRPIRNKIWLAAMQFISQAVTEERIFRNRPIRSKICLWQPYLLMDRDEMSNIYRGPPINASYQVSVHMAKQFQRRRFFLEINQSETRIVCGGHVC